MVELRDKLSQLRAGGREQGALTKRSWLETGTVMMVKVDTSSKAPL